MKTEAAIVQLYTDNGLTAYPLTNERAIRDDEGKEAISILREDIANLKEYVKGIDFPKTWEQVELAVASKLHKEMYAVGDKFSNVWKDTNNSDKAYDNPLRINHFEDGLELEDGTTVDGTVLTSAGVLCFC